jgi:hypothetical protein
MGSLSSLCSRVPQIVPNWEGDFVEQVGTGSSGHFSAWDRVLYGRGRCFVADMAGGGMGTRVMGRTGTPSVSLPF